MNIKEAISRLLDLGDLTETQMTFVMEQIMTGGASDAQIAAFLVALRMKGETVEEITGAARVMRDKALKVEAGPGAVVDTCGTGGDGAHTFNVSTTAAFVAAGAGLVVAKHGNRAISSKSGSADVLKALGVNVEAEVSRVEECLKEAGIGFLFAPALHSAMRFVMPARRDIGARTIFNVLGPLTNPAGAKRQVMGVYDRKLIEPLAVALGKLGAVKAFVVHGQDGLDEITVTAPTYMALLENGQVKTLTITPEQFGIPIHKPDSIKGGDAEQNAKITRHVLEGEKGAHRDITLLNAAAVICAGGLADFIDDALPLAEKSIDTGVALEKLEKLVKITNS
ncbi:MAG: anthranilate phosphoribosyltransferase [Nitrospinae bacterium]|nr:anthranilate phosphoribosyltransferase [Nitrospinota bacterium]